MNGTQLAGNGIAVVAPSGRVDSIAAASLGARLQRTISAQVRRLVVDMSGVTFIGSKGLQALLTALAECRRRGGDLKLVGVSPDVLHVLRLIEFDRIFSFCSCVESAIADFRARNGHEGTRTVTSSAAGD